MLPCLKRPYVVDEPWNHRWATTASRQERRTVIGTVQVVVHGADLGGIPLEFIIAVVGHEERGKEPSIKRLLLHLPGWGYRVRKREREKENCCARL
ncbi:unnamed protein product [Malus baccata var. baccata]